MSNELQSSARLRLCRLCLTDKDDLYPIFGGPIADLAEKIYDCTAVEINYIEGIPALICQLCRSKIIVCHQFVESSQKADRKFHRLYGPQFRQHKQFKLDLINGVENHGMKDGSIRSEPKTRDVIRTGDGGKQLVLLPSKTAVNPVKLASKTVINSLKQSTVHRLANDDKLGRHPIDCKIEPKLEIKRPRLSEDSIPEETPIQVIAAKIEQSLKDEFDGKVESGRRKCPTCGLLVLNYQKHKKLHSTIRKHVCGICNKTFSKRCYLTYHANLHSGERPFKCPECDKCFSSPQRLNDHKMTASHNGTNNSCVDKEEQPHKCNVCHLVFSRKLLDQHMSTHQRERNYSCETCGNAYYTRTYLYKHKKEVHGWVDRMTSR